MQELYEQYKGLLFNLAYQLTGSVSDAEDVVQDVFLKAYQLPPEKLTEPGPYLCKMVTNRCRDLYKSARKKREEYFGEWLPEPLVAADSDPADSVARDDLLSYAMLVLLERLSASERAVFVLREALGFEYGEIARLMDKSEVNCRKLFSRASAKMGLDAEAPLPAQTAGEEWVDGFVTALKQGNMNRLLSMLDPDVVLLPDGGGKVQAAVNPIHTAERVAKFLMGIIRKAATIEGEVVIHMERINGEPGMILRSEDGVVHTAALFRVEGGLIRGLYILRNPDKLKSLA
ncbi:sigma-70 family RNA polymerase sigma factor [Paenibacillus hemerocallicola]|uniref:Sigma-70 family RNA polymerase sigma factor n=1 Tax=Paenibacillus hemerocallicola TaxID=1172614 RepID=A0A5C4T713_9BACL|nr:RNA polymerase sigma factor SigJ [Paenibacillus hemerocallicola]TNJ64894.1 sigma-70 family RNA polymerase sigma factor [Paenibacillus hemerocallicola]